MKSEDRNMEVLILEAAEKLFMEQGFASTTTAQIAKLAGCNQALVHYYYRTKENLFDRVYESKVRMMVQNISQTQASGDTFLEKIAALIKMHLEFLKNNPRLVSFVLSEATANPERMKLLIEKLRQYPQPVLGQLDDELKQEIEAGRIRPIAGIDLLLTIFSLNVTPFLLKPVIQMTLQLNDKQYDKLLEERKKEIVETVLSRLRP